MDPAWLERFSGIDRLYGRGTVERLSASSVCVIGVGGVGSWVVEALARSGVGRIRLVDADDICVSNCNRQLHALDGQFGRNKVDVVAARAQAISPLAVIEPVCRFLTADTIEQTIGADVDVVIDACDAFRVKVELIAWCRRNRQRVVVVGSAGGRRDPTQIRLRDLSRTEHDAMLALIRKKLRAEFGFPKNPSRYFGIQAVYSLENVNYPQPDGSVCGLRPKAGGSEGRFNLDCGGGLGAATHVTASFGMAAVSRCIDWLIAEGP